MAAICRSIAFSFSVLFTVAPPDSAALAFAEDFHDDGREVTAAGVPGFEVIVVGGAEL